jgi:hypothetical protein
MITPQLLSKRKYLLKNRAKRNAAVGLLYALLLSNISRRTAFFNRLF